ncbi:MAG: hydroxyacid dehydrogenase [Phycisphaerales bacterium]|nr:hydroxyacid dehydrogenase [Phycisphaerales bacterium]
MKVLIADKFQDHGVGTLREAGCEVFVQPGLKDSALAEAIQKTGCNVLVVRGTKVTGEHLRASPHLELVIRAGSGVDTIDVDAATERGIRVTNCPGKNSVAVAELTIGLMIALDRRIVDETDDLRRGVWNKKEYSKARGLKSRTLGIVGLGRIGYEVARRARAFEMRLIYSDVVAHPEIERELGITRVDLTELLGEADFVTLHVPGGSETRHIIAERELALMKATAFVINCSRGGVVDEAALADAVQKGTIAGAALDVYEIEPTANDTEFRDPLGKVSHVYGTHHVGASTEQAQEAVAEEVVKIVRTYLDTGRTINCVNLSAVMEST